MDKKKHRTAKRIVKSTVRRKQIASKALGIALACLMVGTVFGTLPSTARAAGNFNIGDTVEVTANLNVRTGAGTGYPEITDPDYPSYAPQGTIGKILSGPSSADGYIWWKVDFGPGLYSGWSVEGGLKKVSQPPSPPRNLRVTEVGSGYVKIAWDTPSNDGGSSVTNYKIYRGTSPGGESLYTTISADWTTFNNNANVVNGTTYYYKVKAVNAVGDSGFSNEVSATVPLETTVPSPPRNLRVTEVGSGYVKIAWDTPSNDGGSSVTNYKIYRGTSPGGESLYTTISADWTTFNNNANVVNGTTYYYKVKAVNAVGDSGFSNEVSATPLAPDIRTPISSIDFNNAIVGGSLDKTTTIYNDGNATLTINNITRNGSSDFTYVGPSTPFDVGANSSREITIKFTPSSVGSKSATFTASSNDPDEASVTFGVSGIGTEISISDQQKQQEILNMVNSHRGTIPAELVLAIIRQEGDRGAFYVDGWNYDYFYRESDGPWAQPTNGDGIMQVTTASDHHERSGVYTHDRDGYDHAINDGCDYLLEHYSTYGSYVQATLHYNTGPNTLYIYLGKNWGDRNYLSHVAGHLNNFVPDIYGLQNQDLVDALNQGQDILNNYLYNKGIATGQLVDYYRPYQTQLDSDLHNIEVPSEVSTSIDGHSADPKGVKVGEVSTLRLSFTNIGDIAWTFYAAASLRKPNSDVVNLPMKPVTLDPFQQGSAEWSYTIDMEGSWDVVFGVWKESSKETSLDKSSANIVVLPLSEQFELPGVISLDDFEISDLVLALFSSKGEIVKDKITLDESKYLSDKSISITIGVKNTGYIRRLFNIEAYVVNPNNEIVGTKYCLLDSLSCPSFEEKNVTNYIEKDATSIFGPIEYHKYKIPPFGEEYIPEQGKYHILIKLKERGVLGPVIDYKNLELEVLEDSIQIILINDDLHFYEINEFQLKHAWGEVSGRGLIEDILEFKKSQKEKFPLFIQPSLPNYNVKVNVVLMSSEDPTDKYKLVSIKTTSAFEDLINPEMSIVLPSSLGGCLETYVERLSSDWVTNFKEKAGEEILYKIGEMIIKKVTGIPLPISFLFDIVGCAIEGYKTHVKGWTGEEIAVYLPLDLDTDLTIKAHGTYFDPVWPLPYGVLETWKGRVSEELDEITLVPVPNSMEIYVASPVELRVYDSENRVTGMIKGEIKEEIPDSFYNEENKIVTIFSPTDSYRYEVAGTDEGTYGITVTFVENENASTFTLTNILASASTIHQYTVDWEVLSGGEEGISMRIDSDGDGTFENTFNLLAMGEEIEGEITTPRVQIFMPDLVIVESPQNLPEFVRIAERFEVRLMNVVPETPIELRIENSKISRVWLNLGEARENVKTTIEKLEEKPPGLPDPLGFVWTYHRIEVNVPEDAIENAEIDFWVPKEWLTTHGVSKENVRLLRFGEGWEELTTEIVGEKKVSACG